MMIPTPTTEANAIQNSHPVSDSSGKAEFYSSRFLDTPLPPPSANILGRDSPSIHSR